MPLTALPRSPVKTAASPPRMVARHLARVHAGRRRLARGGQVHRDDAQAQLVEALAQEEQLARLGVEGADHIGGTARAGGDGKIEESRGSAPGLAPVPAPARGGGERAAPSRGMSVSGATAPPAFQRV